MILLQKVIISALEKGGIFLHETYTMTCDKQCRNTKYTNKHNYSTYFFFFKFRCIFLPS